MKKLMSSTVLIAGLASPSFALWGSPTIDASSEEAVQTSVDKILETLDEDETVKFSCGMQHIVGSVVGELLPRVIQGDLSDDEMKTLLYETLSPRLTGKTAEEVMEYAALDCIAAGGPDKMY